LDVYISELKGHSKLSLNRFGHFSRKMTENQPYPSTAACAAARRAMGTLKGEQLA
jgi:hypothetical protein